jgi:F0F1-type ATP synthase beta subunit
VGGHEVHAGERGDFGGARVGGAVFVAELLAKLAKSQERERERGTTTRAP